MKNTQPLTPPETRKTLPKHLSQLSGFLDFIREQGVIGLAVGFILGGAVSKVVTSLVTDIINPILSVALGAAGNLKDAYLAIGPIQLHWGSFASTVIDFLTVAAVVYFGVKAIGVEKLDKKK
jgi:large conductance mechanosensitive channel